MKARQYRIRPKADQDLEDEAFYLALHGGAELGHRFLIAAEETFGRLARNPEIGWHSRSIPIQYRDVRVFPVSGFARLLILYRPQPSGIEILRVLHGSRNLIRLLRKEGVE